MDVECPLLWRRRSGRLSYLWLIAVAAVALPLLLAVLWFLTIASWDPNR